MILEWIPIPFLPAKTSTQKLVTRVISCVRPCKYAPIDKMVLIIGNMMSFFIAKVIRLMFQFTCPTNIYNFITYLSCHPHRTKQLSTVRPDQTLEIEANPQQR